MPDFLTYKHSFNAGDLLTVLPGMRGIYHQTGQKAIIYQRLNLPADYSHKDNHPIKDEFGRQVCMNHKMFDMLKPLIEEQEYVESFNVWEGEKVQFDFDLTRINSQVPLGGGQIQSWPTLIFPQLECDLSIPWVNVSPIQNDKIIINRTGRYQNPYIDFYFLKNHQDKVIFAGTQDEYKVFCEQWGLSIGYLEIDNFLTLAKYIAGCRFFIGGQSMCWHISDSMKKRRILEVCTVFPNTFPTGANGHSFISQQSLEFRVSELLKETE